MDKQANTIGKNGYLISLSFSLSLPQCQGDCCGEMKRERQVVCAAVASSGDLVVFPDKECNETLKPVTTEICERTDCPRWHTSEWAQCDATCGNGNRFREVTCVRGNNIDERLSDEMCECSSPFKPTRVQSCPNLPTCPTSAPCRKSIILVLSYICHIRNAMET